MKRWKKSLQIIGIVTSISTFLPVREALGEDSLDRKFLVEASRTLSAALVGSPAEIHTSIAKKHVIQKIKILEDRLDQLVQCKRPSSSAAIAGGAVLTTLTYCLLLSHIILVLEPSYYTEDSLLKKTSFAWVNAVLHGISSFEEGLIIGELLRAANDIYPPWPSLNFTIGQLIYSGALATMTTLGLSSLAARFLPFEKYGLNISVGTVLAVPIVMTRVLSHILTHRYDLYKEKLSIEQQLQYYRDYQYSWRFGSYGDTAEERAPENAESPSSLCETGLLQ